MLYILIVINILPLLLKKSKSENPFIFQIIHLFDSYIRKNPANMIFSRNHSPRIRPHNVDYVVCL